MYCRSSLWFADAAAVIAYSNFSSPARRTFVKVLFVVAGAGAAGDLAIINREAGTPAVGAIGGQ